MTYTLRDYQQKAADVGIQLLKGAKKNGIIVLPTGAGKSLIIATIADQAAGRTLVLQPSKEILEQNFQKLLSFGRTDTGIYSASMNSKDIRKITLATIGSIHRKAELFTDFQQIIVDECDLVNAKDGMYKNFFDAVQTPVLGLTATPWRMHPGRKISDYKYGGSVNKILTRTRPRVFEEIVHITQIAELFDRGFLTPLKYIARAFDSSKLKLNSTGNDFTDASIKRISQSIPAEILDMVQHTEAKHHLVFTKFIDEAQEAVKILTGFGISAAIVTGETPKTERETILSQFKAGKISTVVNVGVLTVGFDFPALDHIVLARPTNSARLYYQMIGRGIRIFPGKQHCTITDLCGNLERMGRIQDWLFTDNNGDQKYRLKVGSKYLTGVDLKTGEDLERNSKANTVSGKNVLSFGKHKGTPIDAVPAQYLQWIVENFNPGVLKNQAKDELARRAVQNV